MAKKPMKYKSPEGDTYKISYSEELQRRNLHAAKSQTRWLKRNFYAKLFLGLIGLIMLVTILFVLYRLDSMDFFTRITYR